ncbi:MAG: hypothetical protein N0C89_12305 [Candidatus Thiodiazotropha endolucinida]|nr:hypothetical protein [Candidatus Thiodiazotropha taylori]MCG8093457.1 hypothetical protein [Candidatus Thiodiazotropha endolucinida]MCG8062015.1 hypothetical protein [Candidatus Thiodiazotropha taylori]MCG8064913.1 hypothetical protein [Candidatus Thiodiazotropha taylori]MCW4331004.1 hypothetical protein [Candidatus Thiodiazotropha endolucinida]
MKKNRNSRYRCISVHLLWLALSIPTAGLAEQGVTLSQSLRESLLLQGWQEYISADGSVIYRQPVKKPATDNQSPEAELPNIRQFGNALQERGWKVEWDSDGTLILRPGDTGDKGDTDDTPAQTATQTVERGSVTLPANLKGFEYWHIERDESGALLFHPVELPTTNQSMAVDSTAKMAECRIDYFQLDPGVLPLDEWSEVHELTKQWIDATKESGLQVGKIRKINRVYLVSVVGVSEPYRLKYQLAIRISDGGVIRIF